MLFPAIVYIYIYIRLFPRKYTFNNYSIYSITYLSEKALGLNLKLGIANNVSNVFQVESGASIPKANDAYPLFQFSPCLKKIFLVYEHFPNLTFSPKKFVFIHQDF